MREFHLIRISHLKDETLGVFLDNDLPFCLTLERPWLGNRRNISCIPGDSYICKRVMSPKFGNTFAVDSVRGRSHILFHKGNISEDTHGCIILGEEFNSMSGKNMLRSSGVAFAEFLHRTMDINIFKLIVRNT